MTKEELDNLVVNYQEVNQQSVFEIIYEYVSVRWRKSIEYDVRFTSTNHHDVQAMYEDKMLKLLSTYKKEIGHFENLLFSSITKGKYDLLRKRSRRRKLEYYSKTEEEAATFLEVVDENTTTGFILSEKTKEQRELLSHLVADVDDLTCEIVKLYLVNDSYLAVGKLLGIEHKRVKRKIESLARRFDGNRFGDYRDYLYA
ncbi:hypothetical protein NQ117_05510 [Paenibacillus sp. SC116]|uniref:hypothetical protein n=1 Tax=Paenibacillus sp. SC116 TaxID=2968986 RepID=UPI00215AF3A0|nr:hypothetical protein [Paenibacillus sp. SC116]MCR8843130.1 hypothetical protein [Paenibacillus sp. SC116]